MTPRRSARQEPCGRVEATSRLAQADAYLVAARLVVDDASDVANPGVAGALAVLAAIAVVWSILSLVGSPGAWACSCAGPPPLVSFEGTAETDEPVESGFGRDYGFRVERVLGGDVRPSEKVRYFTGGSSSCGVGEGLVRGGRYRVDASVSALPGEPRLLFVTLCGGSAQLLSAPDGATTTTSTVTTAAPPEATAAPSDADKSGPHRWPFALAVVAGAAGVVMRRSRG